MQCESVNANYTYYIRSGAGNTSLMLVGINYYNKNVKFTPYRFMHNFPVISIDRLRVHNYLLYKKTCSNCTCYALEIFHFGTTKLGPLHNVANMVKQKLSGYYRAGVQGISPRQEIPLPEGAIFLGDSPPGGDIPRDFAPGGDYPRRFAPLLRGGNLMGEAKIW